AHVVGQHRAADVHYLDRVAHDLERERLLHAGPAHLEGHGRALGAAHYVSHLGGREVLDVDTVHLEEHVSTLEAGPAGWPAGVDGEDLDALAGVAVMRG